MRKKILLIDDQKEITEIYQEILSPLFDVVSFNNPLEVLSYLNNQSVDLIISDIEMPEMSGRVLVEKLKKDFPTLKSIGVSACVNCSSKNFMFDKYLEKPLQNYSELVSIVNCLI